MFIDVTRYGGLRVLRVAIAAIAYLDEVEGGCAVHLVGGETLRANEDVAELEARCAPAPAISAIEVDGRRIEYDPPKPIAGVVNGSTPPSGGQVEQIVQPRDVDAYPAKRGARGRTGR